MRRIILCDGETDATLIGLYLEKISDWTYANPKNKIINIPKNTAGGNKSATHYSNGNENLVICSVGGKDNFGQFFTKYVYPMIKTVNKEENLYRIALITDADDRNISDIEADISEQLSCCIQSVSNNIWCSNLFEGDFDDNISVDFLLCVIPKEGSGALETVLLDSLAESQEGKSIVDSSVEFVDNMPYYSYIPTDRLKLKAKLGVALSIIYPDKVFSQFDKQLQIVDWSKSTTLSDCLSEVIKI